MSKLSKEEQDIEDRLDDDWFTSNRTQDTVRRGWREAAEKIKFEDLNDRDQAWVKEKLSEPSNIITYLKISINALLALAKYTDLPDHYGSEINDAINSIDEILKHAYKIDIQQECMHDMHITGSTQFSSTHLSELDHMDIHIKYVCSKCGYTDIVNHNEVPIEKVSEILNRYFGKVPTE